MNASHFTDDDAADLRNFVTGERAFSAGDEKYLEAAVADWQREHGKNPASIVKLLRRLRGE